MLGLVDVEQDQLLRETESTQTQLEREKARIPDLERAPAFALGHAERQLRARVRSSEDEPVFRTLLGESVETRFEAALEAAAREERAWEQELEQLEPKLTEEQLRLTALNKAKELAEVDVGIAKSLVDTKEADFERLTNLRNMLEGLDGGRCDHGDVEFSECDHIRKRKNSVSMAWHRDGKEAQASAAVLAQQLAQRETEFKQAAKAVIDQSRTISDSQAALRRVHIRIATSVNSRTLLKQAWDELQLLYFKREQGTDSGELIEVRNTVQNLEQSLDKLKTDMTVLQAQHSQRLDAVKSMTACVSTRLLGQEGRARFIRGHELRPFEVARGGEAYQVLEVLLGDIVCLLDSVVSNASAHPGFLVHDCPREADMSERLYKEFFLAAAEAAEQLVIGNAAPFQFIVTTTSPPPEELRSEKYIALELEPGTEESLLFKRQLSPELQLI